MVNIPVKKTCKYCRRAMREIPLTLSIAEFEAFKKTNPAVVCDYCDRFPMMAATEK